MRLSYSPHSVPKPPQCRRQTNPHFSLSYTPVTSYARTRTYARVSVKFVKFAWVNLQQAGAQRRGRRHSRRVRFRNQKKERLRA